MELTLIERIREAKFPLDSMANAPSTLQRRASSLQEIFSNSSELVATQSASGMEGSPHIAWSIATALILLLCLYCALIYRYKKPITACLKALFSLEDTFFIFENTPTEFKRFLSSSRALLFLSISIVGVGSLTGNLYGGFMGLLIILGAIAYLYLSILLQDLLRLMVSRFDSTSERISSLRALTLLDFSTMSVIFCPIAILSSSIEGLWIFAWSVFSLMVLIHWLRLFFYFKFMGFSILQWILYLCTLEVLPFAILINVFGLIESL